MSIDSLQRRMRALHSLWEDAVASMTLEQVNYVERKPVLPIAFSLFHMAQIEDGSAMMLGAGDLVYDDEWGKRIGLAIADHGKHKTVDEMVEQRIGDYEAYCDYQAQVFARTENWLATLDEAALDEVFLQRPFPPMVATTYSARVAGEQGMTKRDAIECWIYQHGLRHMGEVEHARALVGLQGMTS
jgi:hypothetical protein